MAQFMINITDPGFDRLAGDETRRFIIDSVVPTMVDTLNLAKSVSAPAALPRGGEVGCSASTGGGGSVECHATVRW